MDSYEVIKKISESKKKTPAKVYLQGDLDKIDFSNYDFYGSPVSGIMFVEYYQLESFIKKNEKHIAKYRIEVDRRNSAIPMADLTKYNCRIEPGAIIRDMVEIGDNCVIMMGAVVNIGAVIGEKTMLDMNVVVGGRAIVGSNCHIGAGTVLAGVIEPPSADPVIIEDDVMIGANVVILEGIKVGKGAVIAAGSVVIKDVEPYIGYGWCSGKIIKES